MKYYYVAVHADDRSILPSFEVLGNWNDYYIYKIDNGLLYRLDFQKIKVVAIPENLAHAWKFASEQREYLTFREASLSYYNIDMSLLTNHKEDKYKYFLTEKDKQDGVEFAKLILKAKFYREFDNVWSATKPLSSSFSNDFILYLIEDLDNIKYKYKSQVMFHINNKILYENIMLFVLSIENKIDSIKTQKDVNEISVYLYNTICELPEMIKDRKIKDVQRSSES